jgi:hypothetical protein
MQTALTWYIVSLSEIDQGHLSNHEKELARNEVFEKALAMEKEQITNAYWDGGQDIPLHASSCENYYNKTYKP